MSGWSVLRVAATDERTSQGHCFDGVVFRIVR